jgi:acyl-CoA reductase-like NAD-dependent aldehyde dehydrogenase
MKHLRYSRVRIARLTQHAARSRFDCRRNDGHVIDGRDEAEDVNRAVDGAWRAFDAGGWSRRPPVEQSRLMRTVARLIEERGDTLAHARIPGFGQAARCRESDMPSAASKMAEQTPVADADLDQALDGSLFTSFFNSGQVCTTGARLLVAEKRAEEFVDAGKSGGGDRRTWR